MGTTFKPGYFTGETVTRKLAGALLSEVRHVKPLSVPPHSHEAPYFSLLIEGSYVESASDWSVRYEPYTLIFHAAGTEHSDEIGPGGCRMFFAELLDPWPAIIRRVGPLPAHLFELHGGTPAWLVLRLHREFLERDAASALTVESLLFELCSHLSGRTRDDAREPAWMARVDALLQSEFCNRIELRRVAAQTGVDPSHMCRSFRRFRNRTIGEHVLDLRTQLVCRRLVETAESLSGIAQAAGFTDQSHMARVFKRATGATPGGYRAAARNDA